MISSELSSRNFPCFGRYRNADRCVNCINAGLCEYLQGHPEEIVDITVLNEKSSENFAELVKDARVFSVGLVRGRNNSLTSIERAAEILRRLDEPKFRMQLAREMGMSPSTLHGILYRLRDHGFVNFFDDRRIRTPGHPPRFWYRKILCERDGEE